MKVFFEKEYLLELYRDGKTRDKHHRYQPSIVKKYQGVMSSVRINARYRIEFTELTENGETAATICFIQELSNHYQ